MNAGQCCGLQCNGGVCGPPQCTPDGGMCNANVQCCSKKCTNGQCACKQDGGTCNSDAQCCNGQCNGGVCGPPPVCPTTGNACGDCIAESCCGQLMSCGSDPSCQQNVTCFIQCTGNGGGAGQCFFQCVNNPKAIQLLLCLGTSCGQGTCF
jgi:hypothetical protein